MQHPRSPVKSVRDGSNNRALSIWLKTQNKRPNPSRLLLPFSSKPYLARATKKPHKSSIRKASSREGPDSSIAMGKLMYGADKEVLSLSLSIYLSISILCWFWAGEWREKKWNAISSNYFFFFWTNWCWCQVLVGIVRFTQKESLKGSEGGWKDYLARHDKKLGSTMGDPARRAQDFLVAFLHTFPPHLQKVVIVLSSSLFFCVMLSPPLPFHSNHETKSRLFSSVDIIIHTNFIIHKYKMSCYSC